MGTKAGQEAAPRAGYGCERAPPLAAGHALTDTGGRAWVLGRPVGAGGFGAIYLCDRGHNKVGVLPEPFWLSCCNTFLLVVIFLHPLPRSIKA